MSLQIIEHFAGDPRSGAQMCTQCGMKLGYPPNAHDAYPENVAVYEFQEQHRTFKIDSYATPEQKYVKTSCLKTEQRSGYE